MKRREFIALLVARRLLGRWQRGRSSPRLWLAILAAHRQRLGRHG